MRLHSQKGHAPGCLFFLLAVAALIFLSAFRYFSDRTPSKTAREAYLKGDCASALPVFEQLSAAFRPIDFGRIGESAQTGEDECKAFQAADENGIPAEYEFAVNLYPKSPLAPFARRSAVQELKEFSAQTLQLGETCAYRDTLIQSKWITDPGKLLPRIDYVCARFYLAEGKTEFALDWLAQVLERYPGSVYAAWSLAEIQQRTEFCYVLDRIAAYPVILNHIELYPRQLRECGEFFIAAHDYTRAADALGAFIKYYPTRPEIDSVKLKLAEALVGGSKTTRTARLRVPDVNLINEKDIARFALQNGSPHPIRLVILGPEVQLVDVDLCGGCGDYPILGPTWCPGKGPKIEFDLEPGEYQVLVQVLDDQAIVNSVGDWMFTKGNEYSTCFFVVNR